MFGNFDQGGMQVVKMIQRILYIQFNQKYNTQNNDFLVIHELIILPIKQKSDLLIKKKLICK